MTTSLVTGGAGFIGSHVVKHLLDMGHQVIVLDDLSGGFIENLPQGYLTLPPSPVKWYNEPQGTLITADCLFIHGSILDKHLVDHLVAMYKPDYVYHLAAYAAEGLSHHVRRFNYTNNLIGSVNLINAAVNAGTVKRFVFASSIAVYGGLEPPFTEDMTPQPVDPYAIAKYAVELDLRAANHLFGLNYTIFRCHNVYGEYQSLSDPYRNAVTIFIRQCLEGKPRTLFGAGGQQRAFTYVGDIAPLISRSVERNSTCNEVINVGSDTHISVWHLARLISKSANVEAEVVHLPGRTEVGRAYCDHSKARKIFGVIKETPLDEGLDRTVAWARTQPLREPRPFAAIEVERGLPESWKTLSEQH